MLTEHSVTTLLTAEGSKQPEHQVRGACLDLLGALPLLLVQHCQGEVARERVRQ